MALFTLRHNVPMPGLALVLASCVVPDSSGDQVDTATWETRETPVIVEATPEAVRAAFEDDGKLVLTFFGYSGAGYEDADAMLDRARSVLDDYDPNSTIVNLGATVDGIGAVYELAASMGFETTGVVSSQARDSDATFSPFVDRIYIVPDQQWGGVVGETGQLSPTSEAMVEVSDVLVAIGGGSVTRDELLAARARGKEIRFFAADLNHQRAQDQAESRGESPPTGFHGEAHSVFASNSVSESRD